VTRKHNQFTTAILSVNSDLNLKNQNIVYEVKDIEYKFKGGKLGIHKLSFNEESGRLVGIMGASGAGKQPCYLF